MYNTLSNESSFKQFYKQKKYSIYSTQTLETVYTLNYIFCKELKFAATLSSVETPLLILKLYTALYQDQLQHVK